MTLRETLLSTHLFLENEYFEKYVELIENNRDTVQQKCKTQKHHIIPNIAFKLYNWDGANNKDNLVNLLYKNHILAHYYLALAVKENQFKYKMVAAINFILGKAAQVKLNAEELKTFILELDKYQELYEIWATEQSRITHNNMLGHGTSEECKKKISKANSGRVYVNKDGIVRSLHENEVQLFLDNGWCLGNPNCKNRELHKGNTIVNKDGVEKSISKDDLQKYLDDGWIKGRSEEHKQATKNGTQKYYDSLTKEEKVKKCATRTGQHWEMSDDTKEKIKIANTGKKQSEEQKLKNSINKKDTIWMTNGEKDIMVKKELEKQYLEKGFYRGRHINKIKEGDLYE